MFWFHPHVRSDVQVEKGLHGAICVVGDDEPPVDDERILVLDDVRVLADGSLPTYLDDNSKMLGRRGKMTPNACWFRPADVPLVTVPASDVRRLEVRNLSEMDPPFQVLRTNGVATPVESLANKDTVIVPKMSTLELLSRFEEPGRWLYHCQIFEHAEGGRMGEITVSDRRGKGDG